MLHGVPPVRDYVFAFDSPGLSAGPCVPASFSFLAEALTTKRPDIDEQTVALSHFAAFFRMK